MLEQGTLECKDMSSKHLAATFGLCYFSITIIIIIIIIITTVSPGLPRVTFPGVNINNPL
jgi:hypothetical protein